MAPLTADDRRLLLEARFAVLATIRPDGRPRLVPCTFAVSDGRPAVIYTAIDHKPKSSADPRALARVRDIVARPAVSVLAHRWDEEWTRLAWVRVDGSASLLDPPSDEHGAAVQLLRDRYPQYSSHDLGARPVIRVEVESVSSWSATK